MSPARVLLRPGDELRATLTAGLEQWRAGRRPAVAIVAGLLSIACACVYGVVSLRPDLDRIGAVRAALPLGVELSRLPVSAFLPTPELPLVAAVIQLVVVLGLGELILGRLQMIGLAAGAHALCTLLTRVLIVPTLVGLVSLPASQAFVLDTGPSVMTAAVGAQLLLRSRAYACLTLLAGGLLLAAALQNNIDGREHLAALVCGLCLPAAARLAGVLAWHAWQAAVPGLRLALRWLPARRSART